VDCWKWYTDYFTASKEKYFSLGCLSTVNFIVEIRRDHAFKKVENRSFIVNEFSTMHSSTASTATQVVVRQNSLIRQVYAWMGAGLAITAFMSLITLSSPVMLNAILGNRLVFYGIMIGELVLVFTLVGAINKMSAATATLVFIVYSALNGITLSGVALAYTASSITSTFVTTAGMFGAMSLFGFMTKRDLTSWGSFLFMGLIGVVIASVVNIFVGSSSVSWVISGIGVLVFTGLTAYDTWKIKAMAAQGTEGRKPAILGALTLYLDFINLFLMLLRFTGNRR
jgi:FtsH-binding integral membrane protein